MSDSPETRLSLIGRLHDPADSEAWDEFVQIYEPIIHRLARRRGLQFADAAEVTQEVLMRVAKSVSQWKPDLGEPGDSKQGAFRGWLYRVTRNLTIDYMRHRSRLPAGYNETDIDRLPSPSAEESSEFRLEYEQQMFDWAAAQAQASFKPDNWMAFWLSAVEGKSAGDVAQQLCMSRGMVYVARSRVMARIATLINERQAEDSQE